MRLLVLPTGSCALIGVTGKTIRITRVGTDSTGVAGPSWLVQATTHPCGRLA